MVKVKISMPYFVLKSIFIGEFLIFPDEAFKALFLYSFSGAIRLIDSYSKILKKDRCKAR